MKYSVNPNLNAVMNSIEKQLLSKGKDKQESIQIIKRYIKSFPKEPDYNLAQHGGMLVSPYDVRELNIKCGYSAVVQNRISDGRVWNEYLLRVGRVAKELLKLYQKFHFEISNFGVGVRIGQRTVPMNNWIKLNP